MRIFILLLLALGVVLLFTLFPEMVSQHVRLEAFGWVFETRQGAFITSLLVLLALLWLLQRIVSAIFAGPGQLWRTLRMGSKKRQEQRLREGLADMIDMCGDQGRRAFAKSRGAVPEWASSLLKLLTIPANQQPAPDSETQALNIALAARIATDPNAPSRPDAATRKAHLEAWLNARPDAPLAISRLATLAEEEAEWAIAVQLLEQAWKQGQLSAASIKPRLAQAYILLADDEPENRQGYLRKAQRLAPDSREVILALGHAHLTDNQHDAAEKLWLAYLEQNNDFEVATALLTSMKRDALQAFRRLDKKDAVRSYRPAMRWLQASLAQEAGLTGLADEIIESLMQDNPSAVVIRSRADWDAAAGHWEQAAVGYRQLCDSTKSE
jgi:tetratricopeptide (TPR) repeat protein